MREHTREGAAHAFNSASRELVEEEITNQRTRKDYLARQDALQKETQC